jgi:chemotaxis protein methyltransferase CheR
MATTLDLRNVRFEGSARAGARPKARPAARNQIGQPRGTVPFSLGTRRIPGPSFRIAKSGLSPYENRDSPLLPDEPAEGFVAWVIEKAGLDATLYRLGPLLRRLPSCLRMLKVRSRNEAQDLLERQPDLLPAAIGSLLIGVTEFFRDPAVFEDLQALVLPKLGTCPNTGDSPIFARHPESALRKSGQSPDRLRIWSAGCSSGEELFSVAILLADAGLLTSSFLLGSDCRSEAIERARWGLYNAAHLDQKIRRKYFQPADGCWRVIEPLRRRVHWKVADLGERLEAGPWDIILWRNMSIYLNRGHADTLWRRLTESLRPGGYLIVGKAERPPAGLGLAAVSRCIYRGPGTGSFFSPSRAEKCACPLSGAQQMAARGYSVPFFPQRSVEHNL